MKLKTSFVKLKNITPKNVDFSYDFEVEKVHRIIAKDIKSKNAFYTSNCKHPDVEDFIDAKLELGQVTGANISVKVSDEFMQCVISGEPFTQQFPIHSDNPQVTKTIDAKKLWKKMMHNSWKSAEPGILFWDQIIKESPADCYSKFGFETKSTNPCVTKNTLLLTTIGWIQIQNLQLWKNKIPDLKIVTRDKAGQLFNSELEWVGITNKNEDIYQCIFSHGGMLTCNAKHKLYNADFQEVCILDLKEGDSVVSGEGLCQVKSIIKTIRNEDVWDITAKPNLNFFSITGLEEMIDEDYIILNESDRLYSFSIVNTLEGQKFAYELIEGDEIE